MTINLQDIATRYVEAWNEPDPSRRRILPTALWTEDATYCDPVMKGEGHDGIDALIGGVQAKFRAFGLLSRAGRTGTATASASLGTSGPKVPNP